MPPRDRSQIPSRANGAISEDGFFVGTNTKAWSPENDPLGIAQNSRAGSPMPAQPSMNSPALPNQPEVLPATQRAQQAAQQRFQGMQQSQQGQQQQGQFSQPAQSPFGQPQQTPMGMPDGGSSNPMATPGGFQYDQPNAKPSRFGKGVEDTYTKSYEELERARQAVAADPKFSPDQRRQAFERIAARADELDQGFNDGRDLISSPSGFDAPPAEEFADAQGGGLQTMQDGRVRNPQTGDIMRSMRGPNGQLVPVTSDQVEIDALPDGTRYMDANTGKVEIANATSTGGKPSAGGTRSTGSAASSTEPLTREQAMSNYEKWNKGADPMSTNEERAVLNDAINAIADPDQQEQLRAMVQSDPEAAMSAMQQGGVDLAPQLEEARINAFVREQKQRETRSNQIAKAMGIEEPEAEAKPFIDPTKYRTRVGNRGTAVIRRRGSNIDIPAIMGSDGRAMPAPRQMNQLSDLEVDTEFANIVPDQNGREVRVLPFGKQTVNLGNFALTDPQRKIFAKETGKIEARSPETWNTFENLIQQFQSSGEAWDPKNPTGAQQQVQEIVSNFYRELGPEGKAMMTMYVAHGLGFKVDKNRAFTSTGWGKDESKSAPKGAADAPLPTNFLGNNFADKISKVGFETTPDMSEKKAREERMGLTTIASKLTENPVKTASYNQDLGDMAKNMFKIANEQGASKMSDTDRSKWGSRDLAVFRMIDTVAKNKDFGKTAKGKIVIDELTAMAKKMMGNYGTREEEKYKDFKNSPAYVLSPEEEKARIAKLPVAEQKKIADKKAESLDNAEVMDNKIRRHRGLDQKPRTKEEEIAKMFEGKSPDEQGLIYQKLSPAEQLIAQNQRRARREQKERQFLLGTPAAIAQVKKNEGNQ